MPTTTCTTSFAGDHVSIRANFTRGSSPVEIQADDGTWSNTGRFVGDSGHDPREAMYDTLSQRIKDRFGNGNYLVGVDVTQAVEDAIALMTTREPATGPQGSSRLI
jgi:hypothetical protein